MSLDHLRAIEEAIGLITLLPSQYTLTDEQVVAYWEALAGVTNREAMRLYDERKPQTTNARIHDDRKDGPSI